MGLFYDLRCPECGYTFSALFGGNGDSTIADAAKEKIRAGELPRELTQIYYAMGKPSVEIDAQMYLCKKCKSFFTYNPIVLSNSRGTYRERCHACPSCSSGFVHHIRLDDLVVEKGGITECSQECPRCSGKMVIDSGGLYD